MYKEPDLMITAMLLNRRKNAPQSELRRQLLCFQDRVDTVFLSFRSNSLNGCRSPTGILIAIGPHKFIIVVSSRPFYPNFVPIALELSSWGLEVRNGRNIKQ